MATGAGKTIGAIAILIAFIATLRWVNKPNRQR